jgi:hypothetical protein
VSAAMRTNPRPSMSAGGTPPPYGQVLPGHAEHERCPGASAASTSTAACDRNQHLSSKHLVGADAGGSASLQLGGHVEQERMANGASHRPRPCSRGADGGVGSDQPPSSGGSTHWGGANAGAMAAARTTSSTPKHPAQQEGLSSRTAGSAEGAATARCMSGHGQGLVQATAASGGNNGW